ncbi:hypothetical protein OF377_02650 [Ureaplasma sp. ES3154-GEN]|uniref:hypothetical protein n=1 Tax=Ureaplasma sp. ES3154-GEN TaxID=2984844 RepID=UPI0021E7785F|nr:hypothetical protein [Ureaplasma sp. ES3154-GEN]MCV3743762.1 hypothetical protein [Ureaplasma sp. ES3154-GEN]
MRKFKHKKLIGALFAASTLVAAIPVSLFINKQISHNKSLLHVTVTDDRARHSEKRQLLYDLNTPSIVADGYIILNTNKKVMIRNNNNEIIDELELSDLAQILNLDIDAVNFITLKYINNKLIILLGSIDQYENQKSSYVGVYNLQTKNYDLITPVLQASEVVNKMMIMDDNHVLLMNDEITVSDLQNNVGNVVLNLTTNQLTNINFSANNLVQNQYNPNATYLYDIIQNPTTKQRYYVTFSSKDQKKFNLFLSPVDDVLNLSTTSTEHIPLFVDAKIPAWATNDYYDGTKIFVLNRINLSFNFTEDDKLFIAYSSIARNNITFSWANIAENRLINTYTLSPRDFGNKKITSSDRQDRYLSADNRFHLYLNEAGRIAHIPSIVIKENKVYLMFITNHRFGLWKYAVNIPDVYFKGRIVTLKFDENYNEMELDGFRNNNDQLASFIAPDQDNVTNTESENDDYFYGFLNQIENKMFVSNALSPQIYTLNLTPQEQKTVVHFDKINQKEFVNPDFNEFPELDKTQLPSSILSTLTANQNEFFKNPEQINNISINANDLLGEINVSYTVNTSVWYSTEPQPIKRNLKIKGFKNIQNRIPSFKTNNEPSLQTFKTKSLDAITIQDIIDNNLVVLKDNQTVNPDYIKINNFFNQQLIVEYNDPLLTKNYPYLTNKNTYSGFANPQVITTNNGENAISYHWKFNNPDLLAAKLYQARFFNQEIADQLFSLDNANIKNETSFIVDNETNSVLLTTKLYLNPHFFTTLRARITGFGEEVKIKDDAAPVTIGISSDNNYTLNDDQNLNLILNVSDFNDKYISFDLVNQKDQTVTSFERRMVTSNMIHLDNLQLDYDTEYVINNIKLYNDETTKDITEFYKYDDSNTIKFKTSESPKIDQPEAETNNPKESDSESKPNSDDSANPTSPIVTPNKENSPNDKQKPEVILPETKPQPETTVIVEPEVTNYELVVNNFTTFKDNEANNYLLFDINDTNNSVFNTNTVAITFIQQTTGITKTFDLPFKIDNNQMLVQLPAKIKANSFIQKIKLGNSVLYLKGYVTKTNVIPSYSSNLTAGEILAIVLSAITIIILIYLFLFYFPKKRKTH